MSKSLIDILQVAKDITGMVGGAQTVLETLGSIFGGDEAVPDNVVPLRTKPALDDLRATLQAAMLQPLQATFPGLSLEAIQQGRIPVATAFLEEHLRALIGPQEGMKALSLTSEPGRFLLALDAARWGARSGIILPLTCMEFAYGKEVRGATFAFDEAGAEAKGLNFLGGMVGQLPALILLKALRGPDFAQELSRASEGMAQLDWPNLRIDLDKCDELQPIRDFAIPFPDLGLCGEVLPKPLQKFQGQHIGLLDIFTFGPLEIAQDRVWVRVKALV